MLELVFPAGIAQAMMTWWNVRPVPLRWGAIFGWKQVKERQFVL
jgi:hypothetical protein